MTDRETDTENAENKWSAAHSKTARGDLSGHWSTPSAVMAEVSDVLRARGIAAPFAVDVAADPGSAVAPDWFGPLHIDRQRRDALAVPIEQWASPKGPSWLNPPYDKISSFLARCAEYGQIKGLRYPLLVLTFARIDTAWFHEYAAQNATAFWARRGRISFVDPTVGAGPKSRRNTAPTPSLLMAFGPLGPIKGPEYGRWRSIGSRPEGRG